MKKLLAFLLVFVMMIGSGAAYAESKTSQTPPEPPNGAQPPDGQAPPDGMPQPPDGAPGGQGGPGGGSMSENSGTGATTASEDAQLSGESYTSNSADQNALRIESGANVTAIGISVSKTGDSSNAEDSSFYGMNAGILVRDGANVTLSGGTIDTNASGASGVFAYGTGSAVVSDMTITTAQGNSGGVMLAGGGTLTASNLTIETQGSSSAAIRTDRGGGTMSVSGGTYTTHGVGSPAVYSTAVVSVADAVLTATQSEAVVVEGKNSVSLVNCEVSGNMTTSAGGQDENLHGVMIYQSMSGDADVGRSDFAMSGGSLTSLNGDTFYVTNTSCTIELSNVTINSAENGALLRIEGNTSSRGWGTQGSNGGACDMTATSQVLEGEIIVDSISSLNMALKDGSSFTGTVNSSGDAGQVDVTLSADSHWTLSADAHITSFDGSLENVDANGFNLYIGGSLAK